MLIIGHWSINPERMGLRISEYGDPAPPGIHGEKDHTLGNGNETAGSATGQEATNGGHLGVLRRGEVPA